MKTFGTESKSTKMYPTQQKHANMCSKQASSSMPTHDDISMRAYEIYRENGYRQGQSEQDWHQAEHTLCNEKI